MFTRNRIIGLLLLGTIVISGLCQSRPLLASGPTPAARPTYNMILVPTVDATATVLAQVPAPTITPTPDNRPRSDDGLLKFQLPNFGKICISNSADQIRTNFPGATHVSFETIKSDTLEGTGIERKASIEAVTGQHRECSEIPGSLEDGVRLKVLNDGTVLASGNLLKVHDKRNKDIVVVDFNLLNLK